MPPPVTHYAVEEGGDWRRFVPGSGRPVLVHAIRLADGSEWDVYNGWRAPAPRPRPAGDAELAAEVERLIG